jgi:hypothetical protein
MGRRLYLEQNFRPIINVFNLAEALLATIWREEPHRIWCSQTGEANLSGIETAQAPALHLRARPPVCWRDVAAFAGSQLAAFEVGDIRLWKSKHD